ncbi:Gfo/Idh/MocA family protein [Paenibacillus sp. N3.4]|uniref:Gfo/Idh/MocA family protein n=1 Tax=Paenibacillus sp. N3.4 TaxID=2603222 RepID=UPI0011C8C48B|nr:Gfo/Idh/MocA family oxidoreductase [Paenibacillus sp. N3.4]TXK84659.1 Gfo/Idh/MocA family oxidoreductase [Paenibacillus sp. N3.4]
MNKIKIGVIGCGKIAQRRHLPEYANLEQVEIVAVCDIHEGRASEMAALYGAVAYTDYRELLEHERLDAVSVCLPNALHGPVTVAALEAGKHVLCEKPMATSKQEAEAMIAARNRSGKLLMIGHNQRLMLPHKKAKEILSSGLLGRVLTFRTAFGHSGPESWSVEGAGGWFFQKSQAFIGAMGDLGVHKTDLIRYLLGEEITEVGAFVDTLEKENTDVDDNAVCILKTKSGIIGTLAASWTYKPKESNATVFYCERGTLRLIEDPDYNVVVEMKDGERVLYEVGRVSTNDKQTESGIIRAFVECIESGTKPLISGEEGLRSLQVILAALESSVTGMIVKIS